METFKRAVKAVVRAGKWLLFKLGLWVPVAFTLLFFISLAVSNTPFTALAGAYVLGLIATTVFALAVSLTFMFHKFERRAAIKTDKKERTAGQLRSGYDKAEYRESPDKADAFAGGREEAPLFGRESAPAQTPQREERQSAPQNEPARNDSGKVEFLPYAPEPEPRPVDKNFLPYDRPLARDATAQGATRVYPREEQPRIFKTRADENMLVFEYSDRVDRYMRTRDGLVFVSSSPKPRYRT